LLPFLLPAPPHPRSTLFPYTTLFRSYNKIPGFFIKDHTFMPGFPVMAWPMIEWTLDTRYRGLHHRINQVEHSFLVFRMPESRIRSEEHTSELQSRFDLVCRLLLEKKN